MEAASQLNLPAQVVPGVCKDKRQFVKVSSECVQIDAVKKAEAEECLIVRLHECRGGKGSVVLSSEYPVERIVSCNLLEHDLEEAVLGNSVAFKIKPFEIKTFKIFIKT